MNQSPAANPEVQGRAFAVAVDDLSFEAVSQCLYCGGHCADSAFHAQDYFFSQIPGTFAFAPCEACGSLALTPRLAEACLPLAYGSYYTHEALAPTDVILEGREPGLKAWLRRAYVRRRYGGSAALADGLGHALHAALRPGIGDTDLYYRLAPTAPARLLDYGCGGGEYLLRMQRLGHDVTGVDFDLASIVRAREAGLVVMLPNEFDGARHQNRFDLVTLAHVIEHVADPVALLRTLREMLKPGGSLYLEVPQADAAGLAIFGGFWRGLEAPRHLSIPTRAGLNTALQAAGFDSVKQHLRGSVRGWLWAESLGAMPSTERSAAEQAIAAAPAESAANCEFITFTARNPG